MIRLAEDRGFIEGFKDVTSINEGKIIFIYDQYDLEIKGEDLSITAFNKHEMIIKGKILMVSFAYR